MRSPAVTEHTTLALIRSHLPELVAIRRDIHAHPEMGLEEVRTSALVAAKLREWGVEVTEGVGKTGVVGTIKGKLPGQRAILDGPNFLVPTGPGLGIEVDE
jgi:metal-dependent amidase/aminoacylase/carboxypeptidase family protein